MFKRDFFISHASADKHRYIQPLVKRLTERGVTFWLDSLEMTWGDSLAMSINRGLRESQHFLLCLSKAFLDRKWPEAEVNAIIAMQIEGEVKILPLILNSKEEVLRSYPLLAGLIYRDLEFVGLDKVADELASLVKIREVAEDNIRVTVESIHSGRLLHVTASSRASVQWLIAQVTQSLGLQNDLDAGAFEPFGIRWVLVDVNAEAEWKALDSEEQDLIWAVVKHEAGCFFSVYPTDRLSDIGVVDGTMFHLYAIPGDKPIIYHAAG